MNDNCSEIEHAPSKTYSHSSCSSYDSNVQEEEHPTKFIPQLDGCASCSSLPDSSVCDLSLSSSFCSSDDSFIQQHDGNDFSHTSDGNFSNDTSEDEQCEDQFSTIPRIYSANARSIYPKFDDFIEKLVHHRVQIAQIS